MAHSVPTKALWDRGRWVGSPMGKNKKAWLCLSSAVDADGLNKTDIAAMKSHVVNMHHYDLKG